MKSRYKKLGQYIREVNLLNTNLGKESLRGISSIYKHFMPSKANTIGVIFRGYKKVEPRQFSYNPNTARMGDKIPIALNNSNDTYIVSKIYPVFEIIDVEKLLPEYLILWFMRPEFDRYARFKSHGSAREVFSWEEMCNVELPVPSIEEQRAIVNEYNTIVNRIALNNQLIQKLEETAQAIYRRWFVDFQFPDQNGQPYKSNGGEMEWNDELDGDLPKGWQVASFTSLFTFGSGGTPSTVIPEYWNGTIPFFTGRDVTSKYYSILTERKITFEGLSNSNAKLYDKNTTFVVARGATTGVIALAGDQMAMNQSCYAVVSDGSSKYFAHQTTLNLMSKMKKQVLGGAIFKALITRDFDEQIVLEPERDLIEKFNKIVKPIYQYLLTLEIINFGLSNLKNLLLSKISAT